VNVHLYHYLNQVALKKIDSAVHELQYRQDNYDSVWIQPHGLTEKEFEDLKWSGTPGNRKQALASHSQEAKEIVAMTTGKLSPNVCMVFAGWGFYLIQINVPSISPYC
jgi:hypothetical protein